MSLLHDDEGCGLVNMIFLISDLFDFCVIIVSLSV